MPRNSSIQVFLDGPSAAGKSALMKSFIYGYFTPSLIPTIGIDFNTPRSFKVDDIEPDVQIWDISGTYRCFEANKARFRDADIIIECFDISKPLELEDGIMANRIPYFHTTLSKPILLVGLKSDLRQDSSETSHPLFPYEFGPCLAHLVGAVRYMECSAKTNQGVQEVFEEAIRASFEKGYFCGILNVNLKSLLMSKVSIDEEWKTSIVRGNNQIRPKTDQLLRDQLESLDQTLCTALSNESSDLVALGDFSTCRTLEIDTLRLANCDFDIDFIRMKFSKPSMILWCSDLLLTATGSVSDLLAKCASVMKNQFSLRLARRDCSSIPAFFGSCGSIYVTSLVIISCSGTLNLDFLSKLEGLQNLIIIDTAVDLSRLLFPQTVISSLRCLILSECHTDISKIPAVIGMLNQLEILDVTCNGFKVLPESLGLLGNLRTLRCNHNQIVFPPKNVLQMSAQEVVQFLKAFHEEQAASTAYREAKIIVLGQEGVGKSTLVKSLKRTSWIFNTKPPSKTDGVDISILQLPNYDCKVYDLAGDVEYLNTHALFLSHNCLHLAVFDLSGFSVSKGIRSSDLFSRLELWLQTIACQDINSYAIIVGTHADHCVLSTELLARVRDTLDQLLERYRPLHLATLDKVDDCLLCNTLIDEYVDIAAEESNGNIASATDIVHEESNSNRPGPTVILPKEADENRSATAHFPGKESDCIGYGIPPEETDDPSSIPHILGIFEVSGVTNTNVKLLKHELQHSIKKIKEYTHTENIPSKWLDFRDSVKIMLSQSEELSKQPVLKLEQVYSLAYESQIYNQSAFEAMLRFFHAQGDFLWYEDVTVMKDVVIVDPQWLSNQLRTLISHLPHVNAISQGILHHSKLQEIWKDTSEENQSRLITLFRKVGLCFSVSTFQDLFPCKLPVGWPDREMWPSLPKPDESQTTLLFNFSFLPPSFFPDLIVAINEKRASFPSNVKPLYCRFNVVYITKGEHWCPLHNDERLMQIVGKTDSVNEKQEPLVSHRIHFELMPYKNTMKVTIRGPRPCCMIPDVESTIELVKSRRYPGMTYNERVVCPECEMKKLHSPSTLAFDDSHEGFCYKGHEVGSINDILAGKMSSSDLIPSAVLQAAIIMGEVLEDHYCPKLFAVLPINLSSLSLKDRFVHSYLRDGFAVHLLCEAPEEWHFLSSPGFRVGKPKEFFKIHGERVCKLLRVISALGAPFQIASAIDPHCEVGVAAAAAADKMRRELEDLLDDYLDEYPHLKPSLASPKDDLTDLKSSGGLSRTELSRFLEVAAKGRAFGPLTCTYVDKCNEWLWLCEEHNQKYSIVER